MLSIYSEEENEMSEESVEFKGNWRWQTEENAEIYLLNGWYEDRFACQVQGVADGLLQASWKVKNEEGESVNSTILPYGSSKEDAMQAAMNGYLAEYKDAYWLQRQLDEYGSVETNTTVIAEWFKSRSPGFGPLALEVEVGDNVATWAPYATQSFAMVPLGGTLADLEDEEGKKLRFSDKNLVLNHYLVVDLSEATPGDYVYRVSAYGNVYVFECANDSGEWKATRYGSKARLIEEVLDGSV